MGMYDQLNNITRAINETKKAEELKTTKTTNEQIIKYNIISALQNQLTEAEAMGFNLYHEATKDRIITNILQLIENKQFPEYNYLHNKEYTTYFINDNYYKQIAKHDKIQKELEKPKKEHEKILKQKEKEAIKQQKELEKQQKEQLRIKKQLQKQKEANRLKTSKSITKALLTITIIILSPLIIIDGFLIACAKAAK